MSTFTQTDFSGGMDMLSTDTEIAANAYRYLINGRPRFGGIDPIYDSLLINAPRGKKQGIVAVGNIIIIFVAGLAYYQQLGASVWIKIGNFALDSTVEYIYSCLVPASVINNKRVLTTNNLYGGVTLQQDFAVAGTPGGIVCQDGINQPWLIFYDAATNTARARVTKTWLQWTNTDATVADSREYVPIGTLMYYWTTTGILFILGTDGISILRSVTGRPLDFMINIDTNGDKAATQALGDAYFTSISCGAQQVTCIDLLDNSHLLVGTSLLSYSVSLDSTLPTIFGEPQFDTPVYANIGTVNQYSTCDNLGDKILIGQDGIKSTNGVLNFNFVGRNDPFSLMVSKLLIDPTTNKPFIQTTVAVTTFDNYVIASLKTRMGYALLVYDNLKAAEQKALGGLTIGVPPARGSWVSVDITDCVRVKQFAQTANSQETFLFAITEDDEVFQLFGSSNRAMASLRSKSFVNSDCKEKHKTNAFRAIFELGTQQGQVMVRELVDERRGKISKQFISGKVCGVKPPIAPPVIPDTDKLVQNLTFGAMKDGEEGYKLCYIVNWDTDSKLTYLQANTDGISTHISKEQITAQFAELLN